MNVATALDRLTGFFDRRPSRQGWLARRLQNRAFPSDEVLRDQLVGRAAAFLRADGGAADPHVAIGAVTDLVQLGAPVSIRDKAVGWLLSLIGKPGAFGEGCTAARHAHHVCEHFLGGFFGIAPISQRVAPITLPSGKVYRIESQARFAASVWALEAVLEADRSHDAGVQKHLDSFAHLVIEWDQWGEFLVPDLAFQAIGALAVAPPRWHSVLDSLARTVSNHQAADGTWPRVDFFTALAGLCRAEHPLVVPMLDKATPGLLQRQRDDGSFGNVASDERALIGLRVLRRLP